MKKDEKRSRMVNEMFIKSINDEVADKANYRAFGQVEFDTF